MVEKNNSMVAHFTGIPTKDALAEMEVRRTTGGKEVWKYHHKPETLLQEWIESSECITDFDIINNSIAALVGLGIPGVVMLLLTIGLFPFLLVIGGGFFAMSVLYPLLMARFVWAPQLRAFRLRRQIQAQWEQNPHLLLDTFEWWKRREIARLRAELLLPVEEKISSIQRELTRVQGPQDRDDDGTPPLLPETATGTQQQHLNDLLTLYQQRREIVEKSIEDVAHRCDAKFHQDLEEEILPECAQLNGSEQPLLPPPSGSDGQDL